MALTFTGLRDSQETHVPVDYTLVVLSGDLKSLLRDAFHFAEHRVRLSNTLLAGTKDNALGVTFATHWVAFAEHFQKTEHILAEHLQAPLEQYSSKTRLTAPAPLQRTQKKITKLLLVMAPADVLDYEF